MARGHFQLWLSTVHLQLLYKGKIRKKRARYHFNVQTFISRPPGRVVEGHSGLVGEGRPPGVHQPRPHRQDLGIAWPGSRLIPPAGIALVDKR